MKQLVIIFYLTLPFLSSGQNLKDVFQKSETKITWLGIDFSHVKLIGNFNQITDKLPRTPLQIRNNYFPDWNYLVHSQYKKYDINKMFRKKDIILNTDYIYSINRITPVEDLEAQADPNYSTSDIESFINSYQLDFKDGLGIVLIAESLNKTEEYAKYHLVIFDLTTNHILLQQIFIEKPAGMGVRNYWARTFYEVIMRVKKKEYPKWKKQILGKNKN